MSGKRIMNDGNHRARVVFRLLSINSPANIIIVRFVASITLELFRKGGHVGGNLPGLPNGVPLNRRDIEGATVEARETKVMLIDELNNALPTPVRTTGWPLNRDEPPALDTAGSKRDERLPNATKQRIMLTDAGCAPRQLNIDGLPGTAPRTGHRGPQESVGAVDRVLSFSETMRGGTVIFFCEPNHFAPFSGRGGLTQHGIRNTTKLNDGSFNGDACLRS